jgi:type IV pilus assembly protein PilA
LANGWGCESTAGSKYVAGIATSANGLILVTIGTGINATNVDNKVVTLTPWIDTAKAAAATDMGKGVNKWICGDAGDGTTLAPKYLPGSCRGN